MNPSVVAALIAGAISALGLVVQLQIARASRKDAREQSFLKTLSDVQKEAYSNLARLEGEAERLRIGSWEVEARVLDAISGPKADGADGGLDGLHATLEQFGQRAHVFTELWASIRPDIPSGIETYVRKLRHDCLNCAKAIAALASTLASTTTALGSDQSMTVLEALLDRVREHRAKLDELERTVKTTRQNVIGGESKTDVLLRRMG